MSKLRERMINEMKLRRFAPKTHEAYADAVSGLATYNQSPDRIDNEKIKGYLLYLMESRKLAWSSCNVVVCGLRFFYNQTLGRQSTKLSTPGARHTIWYLQCHIACDSLLNLLTVFLLSYSCGNNSRIGVSQWAGLGKAFIL